ncbi:MAG: hypothetical protein AAF740_01035 [Bacteroidota bacterium]
MNPAGTRILRDSIHDLTGLDLVFVDFTRSGDDIFRNAQFLKEVIEWVNNQKDGNVGVQPNVLMGISMGGLVGRVALREMENEGQNHDTRLFITHDTPHRGANTPPGLQAFAVHMTTANILTVSYLPIGFDVDAGLDAVNDITLWDISADGQLDALNDIGPSQMLIERVVGDLNDTGPNRVELEYDNEPHLTFQQQLDALGFPEQTRNVAISNGSECGIPQPFEPDDIIFEMDGRCTSYQLNDDGNTIFGGAWRGLLIDYGTSLGAISGFTNLWTNPVFTLTSILPGQTVVDLEVRVRAVPDRAVEEIYFGRLRAGRKLYYIPPPIMETITRDRFNSRADMLPIDNMPGGASDDYLTADDVPSCFNAFSQNFCFIPTISALNVQGATVLAEYLSEHSRNLLPLPSGLFSTFDRVQQSGITDFVSAPGNNEAHTQFTRRNGEWLINELIENTAPSPIPNCIAICRGLEDLVIEGPQFVCSSPAQYSLSDTLPAGTTLDWRGPFGTETVQGTGSFVRLDSLGRLTYGGSPDYKGFTNIGALIGAEGCEGNVFLPTRRVWFGGEPAHITTLLIADYCNNVISNDGEAALVQPSFTITGGEGAESYEWTITEVDNPSNTQTFTTTIPRFSDAQLDVNKNWEISVTATNPCGTTTAYVETFFLECESPMAQNCESGRLAVGKGEATWNFLLGYQVDGIPEKNFLMDAPFYGQVWTSEGKFMMDYVGRRGRASVPIADLPLEPEQTYQMTVFLDPGCPNHDGEGGIYDDDLGDPDNGEGGDPDGGNGEDPDGGDGNNGGDPDSGDGNSGDDPDNGGHGDGGLEGTELPDGIEFPTNDGGGIVPIGDWNWEDIDFNFPDGGGEGGNNGEEEPELPDFSNTGICLIEGNYSLGAQGARIEEVISTNPFDTDELLISPNPSSDWIQIYFTPASLAEDNPQQGYTLSLVESTTGRTVLETNFLPNTKAQLSVRKLVSQVYILKISDGKRSWQKRVLVIH